MKKGDIIKWEERLLYMAVASLGMIISLIVFAGIITFILAIVFTIVSSSKYSSSRRYMQQGMRCNYCQNFMQPGMDRCPYCGQYYQRSQELDVAIQKERKDGKTYMIWAIVTGVITVLLVVAFFVVVTMVSTYTYDDYGYGYDDYSSGYYDDYYEGFYNKYTDDVSYEVKLGDQTYIIEK